MIAKALVAVCTLLVAATAVADARCSRTTYRGFIRDFEHTRGSMRSRPAAAYSGFLALSRNAATCLQNETNKEVRFKLLLFQIGLRAYIGAANAEMGHVALGSAQAQGSLTDAQRLVRENRSKPVYFQLAEELVAQLRTPLAIIQELQGSPSPQPKPTA